jgi:uncharacterized ion transporter superfamily protein YfcC
MKDLLLVIINLLFPFLLFDVVVLRWFPFQRDSAFLYGVICIMLLDLVFQSGYSTIEPFELNSEGICTSLCSGLPLIVAAGESSVFEDRVMEEEAELV